MSIVIISVLCSYLSWIEFAKHDCRSSK